MNHDKRDPILTKRLYVDVSPEMFKDVELQAARLKKGKAEFVRDAIAQQLKYAAMCDDEDVKEMLMPKKTKGLTLAQELFIEACKAHGLDKPTPEFKFHPDRKWMVDWVWCHAKLALEIEGGAWSGGRHTRGAGFLKDMEKYNELAIAGFTLLRCTPQDVESGKVFELLKRVL